MADDDAPATDGDSADEADLAAELARLREENARLSQQVLVGDDAAPAGPRRPRHVGRWTASWVLIVVGSLLVPVSVLSVWLNRTVTDTDRYVETVAPLIRDHDIQRAIQTRLETALYDQVDLEAEVQQVLPDRATLLAAPITAGLKNLISEVIARVVTSDRVAELWDDANRIAQEQVVDVLTVSDGKKGVVEIDLTDTLKEVQQRLEDAGVPFVGSITVPKVQLEVLQSDTLGQVQTAFGIFDRLVTVLPWLTLIILGAGIAVAPDRRKGLVRAASGWVIASFLLLVGVAIGRTIYLDALPSGTSIPANTAFFNTITRFLRGSGRMILVLGLLVLLAALISGPSGPAVRFRSAMGRLFGAASSGVDRTGVDLGPVPAFVARNAIALRVVVAVAALGAFLLLGQPSAGAVLWIAFGALVALAVIEVLARAGAAARSAAGAEAPSAAVAPGDGPSDGPADVPGPPPPAVT
ncbi:hypothetical protein [Dermatobacter hominis]|uniref:hypothetical protein n=1 Tax=Dermatobacter hominis TaxID=2884263 RepID=UPI001D12C5AB|nr:hypothetical protein [Dermatobacter hominis]UDY35359.1 hypothetical protein LH044_18745 [Dermatobacter hominis]